MRTIFPPSSGLHRRASLALLAGALISACSDSTAPGSKVHVTLSAAAPSVTIGTDPDGLPSIECSTSVLAVAAGSGAATWLDGTARYFIGASRSNPTDSSSLAAGEIRNSWGSDSIQAGQTQHASWAFHANIPFEVALELRYRDAGGGAVQKVSTRFACGPVPSGSVALPTVNNVSAQPRKTPLQPGDTIIVSYDVSSTFGLWATVIDFSGGFTGEYVVAEGLAKHSAKSVAIVVPGGSQLNVPIVVKVTAFDAATQLSSRTLATQMFVADLEPPTIFGAMFGDLPGNQPGARLNGQFAVGEIMPLQVAALDNNEVSWLVYEVTGPTTFRDSVPNDVLHSASAFWSLRIPARPEWVGAITFSIYIRDGGGLLSAPGRSKPDSLHVYPIVTPPMRTGTILSSSYPAKFDAKRNVLYLSRPGKTIGVYNLATMADETPISLTSNPGGIDLSPTGDSLVVTLPDERSLAIVDLTQAARPVTTLHLALLDTVPSMNVNFPALPRLVTIAANGKAMLYLNDHLATGDAVIEHDLRTGMQRVRADAKVLISSSDFHQAVGATGDRTQLYHLTPCAQRYEVATDAFTPCKRGVYTYAWGHSADRTGQRFTWGDVLYGAGLDSLRLFALAPQILDLKLTPDGQRVIIAGWTGITIADANDGHFIERIPLPTQVSELLIAPDGLRIIGIQERFSTPVKIYDIDLR